MRKTAAILLTSLLFINLIGYKVVFYFATEISDTKLEASLDKKSYDEAQLITVTVPLNNPYHLNQSDFERVNGEMTIEGKIYKYVKRRIYNNELILLCIPDDNKTRIEEEKKSFYENTNAKQENSKAGSIKYAVTEYDYHYLDIMVQENQQTILYIKTEVSSLLSAGYLSCKGKPPRLV